ncbi:histidine kinase N-terminal 7TM domain-containing protein [Halorientalis sp.]|uniref:histidine kinase N-terminal 7TM domain-containing protein n=1 Tax=Halorientalis sp. TaxID=1931229 RepID=UPI0026060376|nr:histidine kinase N-terminal 7TM domain-containing protein [Halorientalis sp.]
MTWQYTPFLTLTLIAAGLVGIAALYVVRQQRAYEPVPGGYVAVVLAVAICWVLLTYALQIGSVELSQKLLWYRLGYIGFMPVPVLLLLFTLQYTGRDGWLRWWSVGLVSVIPLAMIGLAFTNERHQLVWSNPEIIPNRAFAALRPEYGDAVVVYVAVSVLLSGASIALLLWRAYESAGIYRRQSALLVTGTVVPVVAAGVYFSGMNPLPGLELMTISLAITGGAFCWAVGRHGLFTLIPIASQAAVEQMDDAVVVIDIRGLVVNVNEQAEPFLTVDPSEAVGGSVGAVLRPFAVPPAPRSGEPESDREVVTNPETGRSYQRTGTPLTDSDGVVMGQLVVLQDITERVRRERRLRQQNEQLEEFASVVSHDLRNPLNVISARSQLARESGEVEHFEALDRAADRMDRLIDDLLQLARQGQTVDETERVSLREVAGDAWSLVNAPQADLQVEGKMFVEADRDRLQQAFENLFRNAVDHVGADVSLVVEPLEYDAELGVASGSTDASNSGNDGEDTDRTRAGFVVEDDGPGIPAEERQDVFDYGHTTEEDGTGFGLAIVKEIVEAHGWEIRAVDGQLASSHEADEYGGARFEVTGVTTAQGLAIGETDVGFDFG